MSQFSAVATPPPMQKPRIRAIVGLAHLPSLACAVWPTSSYRATCSGVARVWSNSEMSAPATKALSPAPVTTTTRISGSASNASRIDGIAAHISKDAALRFSGLLKVSRPTAPCFAAIILGVGLRVMRSALDDAAAPEVGDHVGVVAGLRQDLVGVLALLRGGGAHGEGRAAHLYGLADELDLAQRGGGDRLGHLQVPHLRIG